MEARALHCDGCGAPVSPEETRCPYCQAQLATVACPACFTLAPLSASHCPGCGAALAPREAPAPGGAPCPACAKPLVATQSGGLDVQACQACGGLWLDRAIFEQLGASRERQGAVLGALPAPASPPVVALEPVQYRPCPACARRMNRVNYARRSGVVLDVCKPHGIWFDRNELLRVLAFIAGGGLDRAREEEIENLRAARRDAMEAPLPPFPSGGSGQQAGAQGSWFSPEGLRGLASDVAGFILDRD